MAGGGDDETKAEPASDISTASTSVVDGASAAARRKTTTKPLAAAAAAAPEEAGGYLPLRGLADIRTSRDLTKDALRDILRRHTSDHSLEIVSIGRLADMSGLNDAFNSTICSLECRASISSSAGDDDDDSCKLERDFHFVVKSPPSCSVIRFVHKFTTPFCNEVSWYVDLVRQVEAANGKDCLGAGVMPVCYHASSSYYSMEQEGGQCCSSCPSSLWMCSVPCRSSENGVLILENVKKKPGKAYSMFDKHKPVPIGHVELILSQLARFHGMWLRYRFASQSGRLEDAASASASVMPWETFLRRFRTQKKVPIMVYNQMKSVAKKTVVGLLSKFGDESERETLVNRCRRFFDVKATRTLGSYFSSPPSPECHTLCHGDFWSNNILFSYDDDGQDRVPKDLIIIDYQLVNYGHPCYDLVYFLYLNTDLEFRDAHLERLLRAYYRDFSSYFDVAAEPLLADFTFEKFLADFEWHKQIGFTTACSVMPNVLSDVELNLEGGVLTAFRELQRKQRAVLDNETDPSSIEIRRRLMDLIREMARDNVI